MAHETSALKLFLKEATDDDLQRRLKELKEEHFRLRIQAATSALDNPKRIWFIRKQVARLQTEVTRRQLGEAS